MAWALQFDGVNDYAKLATPVDFTGDFSLEIDCDIHPATSEGFLELSTSTNNFFGKLSNNTWYCRMAGSTVTFNFTPVAGRQTILWARVGSTITAHVDGVLKLSTTFTAGSSFDLYGRLQGGNNIAGNLYGMVITDPTGTYNYDPTASSHAAGTPILTDTIGGNNATGFNMPTDGSAWVDLGGSGVTVTATLGTIDYTSIDTIVSLAGAIDLNTTLGAISYSSQNVLVSLAGSIDLSATLGAINYSSQNTTVSVTGDVDVIVTLGAINYLSNNATISLASETIINTTLGAIDYTSQDTAVILSGLIDITSTLGSIVYNSYPVIVSIGEGQVIGNVTTSFADNIYTAGFKPATITVSFK